MGLGQATVTLRPLRFALLVELSDPAAVLEAIRINTFLWGGSFNPIIPVFSLTPANWRHGPLEPPPPREIVAGYIRSFDPDILVACGKLNPSVIDAQGRKVIGSAEITAPIPTTGVPGYGIGLFEILADLAEKEFKYVRRDGRRLLAPTFSGPVDPLFAALFGDMPEGAADLYEQYLARVEVFRPEISLDNFLDFFAENVFFRRQILEYRLDVFLSSSPQRALIFHFDHTDSLDVIDLWNLRAVGWDVLPLPRAIAHSEKAKDIVRGFYAQYEQGASRPVGQANRVIFLKGRSLSEGDHRALLEVLRDTSGQPMMCQFWYPQMWDEFTINRGHFDGVRLEAKQRTIDIGDDGADFRFQTLSPPFMSEAIREGAAYANDLEFRRYGGSDFRAAVIPPDEQTTAMLFGMGLPDDWRVGANGVSYLGRYVDRQVQVSQPAAKDVVANVIVSKGWSEFQTSPAGNIAYQMMRHLGGPYGINLLKSRLLIRYLEELSRSNTYDLAQTFFTKIKKIASDRGQVDAHYLAKRYTDSKIFTLGVEVLCPVCTQRSWYGLDVVDYDVQCPKCLGSIKLPIHNPLGEIKWAYRNAGPFTSPPDDEVIPPLSEADAAWAFKSHGPFAAPKRGGGAYSLLLTVNFLTTFHNPSTTTALSFIAKDSTNKPLEADFTMFYRNAAHWQRRTEWVFGECKTFNRFKQKDIERMQAIADSFPDSVLVFATLNENFSDDEKALLLPFVKACRPYGKLDRPLHGVLLLTATELFSMHGPSSCWKDMTGKGKEWADGQRPFSSLLELCDATQTLYLDLEPWSAEWRAEFERRREIAEVNAADVPADAEVQEKT